MLRGRMVDVDVILTGRVPMPHAYVFRPESWNPLLRAAQVFRPGGETVRGVALAYVVRHPTDGEPHGPFASTIDLLGDGSVRLLSTPGHTPGHMSVLLNATGDRQVLVVGDAAYTLRSIEEERLSLLAANDDHYRSSLREIKAF